MIQPPKNEILWVQYLVKGNPKYVITSNKHRNIYYLHEVVDGNLIKTRHKNKDPAELEKYIKE